jgi:hypothetical protein
VPYQSQPTIDIPVGDDSSFIVSGNSANYVTFYGGRISSTSFDITFEILGRGNAHIGFLANRTQRATQAYEVRSAVCCFVVENCT